MKPHSNALNHPSPAFTECPLCEANQMQELTPNNDHRTYAHCLNCGLIHAHPSFRVSLSKEIERYEEHHNSPNEPGYISFLNKIVEPASKYLSSGMKGCDYGCGPGPAIDVLLKEQHIECSNYDPIFYPEFPQGQLDFVFSTECFEHFNNPKEDIEKVLQLIKPDGYLFVMTQIFHSTTRFMNWYYKRDQTHVSFFSMQTWEYLCNTYNLELLYHDEKRIFLLRKLAS